jgi:hypothetical protein
MHDQAFERGLFAVDLELRVWVDPEKAGRSPWAAVHLAPYHGRTCGLARFHRPKKRCYSTGSELAAIRPKAVKFAFFTFYSVLR